MSASKNRNRVEKAVGIDVSAKELHVAVEDSDKAYVFENGPEGFPKLLRVLTKGGRSVRVVVEPTGSYHLDLCLYLHEQARCRVMVADARMTKHFHNAQGIRAKTDKVDAASLLEFARRMEFVQWQRPSDDLLDLRAIVRYRDQLVKEQTRLKNQLHAAKATVSNPAWMLADLNRRLEDTAKSIEATEKQLQALAERSTTINEHVEKLTTIPGVGFTTAIHLVAELVLLDPTMTSSEITAWAGLDPRPRESGTSVRGSRAISKRGNARVRVALYMPAITTIRRDGPFKRLHERVSAASGIKMKGIVAVMRKLLIVAWAIIRTGEAWNASKASPKTKVARAA